MSSSVSSLERYCHACGAKLSRYNPTSVCWSCQKEKRVSMPEANVTPPLPSPAYSSAFTLRSIVDTIRRTKPLQHSDVGQILKHYRSLHQLTQRDLAELLGFDQSYISKLENGQHLRDIATLNHIAVCLGIPGQWLGITTEQSSVQYSELIEMAPSVIRLCQTVRENGRADAAVNELWSLLLRLDTPTAQDKRNPRLFLTLAAAQATLGVILGDLLPEEALWISVHFFKKAIAIVDEHGDTTLKTEVYRGCGNELRKQKQYSEAISYLEQAFFLAPDIMNRGIVAALLARSYGEMGDKKNFDDAMRSVLYTQERATFFTPTFNPIMVHEVHLRGHLKVRQMTALRSLVEQDPSESLVISVAPQWSVISRLTRAEALFSLGKLDDGLDHLKTALVGAEICKLPHQVQRALRTLRTVEAYGPAKALGDEAQFLFDKLSYPIQLPSHLQ